MEKVLPFIDWTVLAEKGGVDSAAGRDKETLQVLEILARHRSKSVLLIGRTGAGKTHLARGLAVAGLRGASIGLSDSFRLLELDLGMLAIDDEAPATKLQRLLRFLRTERETVLFVDDLHQFFNVSDPDDSTNPKTTTLLSRELARGKISCVAATTPEGFEESLIHNRGIRDHFEMVHIDSMTPDTAWRTLRDIKSRFEEHHKIVIPFECLDTVIELSDRYMDHMDLPGKAIEVLDRACSRARFQYLSSQKALTRTEAEEADTFLPVLGLRDVEAIIEEVANVSNSRISLSSKWQKIEKRLRDVFVGQPYAISAIVDTLRDLDEKRSSTSRPEAIFLFWGPANSGMTLMARELAALCLGSRERLLRFNMRTLTEERFSEALTEYQRKSSMIRTKGTPLPSSRYAPSVVLVFDGVEYGDATAFDFILSILDAGAYTDPRGGETSLRNAIVVFMSKRNAQQITRDSFEGCELERISVFRRELRKEFDKKLDAVIPFIPLSRDHVHEMTRKHVLRLRKEFNSREIGVAVHKDVYTHLADCIEGEGITLVGLLSFLDTTITTPLRRLVQEEKPERGSVICVLVKDNRLAFRQVPQALVMLYQSGNV